MIAASASIRPSRLSAPASRITPPSELIRPPSNAAVTFFWPILGRENGRKSSSSAVGMANSVQASRVEEATNLYGISDTCTIAIHESLLCDELDGLDRRIKGQAGRFDIGQALAFLS